MTQTEIYNPGKGSFETTVQIDNEGSTPREVTVKWIVIEPTTEPEPFTRTFCAGDILEVSEKDITVDDPKEFTKAIKKRLMAGECTEKEIEATRCLKTVWAEIDKSKVIIQAKEEPVKEETTKEKQK